MTTAVTLLLDAAAKSGVIRSGFDPQDVLLAVAASTWAFVNDGNSEERTLRVLRLVMDGLRYKAAHRRGAPSAGLDAVRSGPVKGAQISSTIPDLPRT
jgi:hypothetical protein